jgi:myo-inositol-1(or 4)-monophosphatase
MTAKQLNAALTCAVDAAHQAGRLMRQNLHSAKRVNEAHHHDIKLELDVRCQVLIERMLRRSDPAFAVLGEEGVSGPASAEVRWVVDPIDGTVNFAHDVPHACVCIALQFRNPKSEIRNASVSSCSTFHGARIADHETVLGVIYDPFADELWTAMQGQPARMNGRVVRVSRRAKLAEAMVTFGFSKSKANLEKSLPYFAWLCRRARKVRIMGAAGLGLTYVACGRFDAYVERKVRLWDIAAGALIVERAGGAFWCRKLHGHEAYSMVASNGLLDAQLPRPK